MYASMALTRTSAASSRHTDRSRSTRAFCCFRSSAFCPRRIRASSEPSRPSSNGCWSRVSSCATTPERLSTGCPPGKGCSFWLADNYILQGRVREGRELFERLLSLRNDVGLLAEEYDPRLSRQTGNFPQAFSHVALVNTAFNLTRAEGPAQQRADRKKARRHLVS